MTSSRKSILRIVAFFDGRLGHEKQTLGIIQALQQFIPVDVTEIRIERATLLESIFNTARLLFPGKGRTHPAVSQADLLIGAGTQTHLPLLLHNKDRKIPVCVCMNPAFHLRHYFDFCFIPAHDGVSSGKRVFHTLGAPNNCKNLDQHDEKRGLILLGGVDPKSHIWDNDEIIRQVRTIIENDSDKIWTISSSPRTPKITVEKVEELSNEHSHVVFFDYRDTAPGWLEKQYNKNSIAWVTSDSISMVYEALTAGCRVGIFPMRWISSTSKFKRNEDVLLKKKLVLSFSSWEQKNATWGKPAELNEAQRCAEQILLRWWPKNLQ